MSRLPYLVFVLCALTAAGSCGFTKDLERHRADLLAAVGPDVPLAEKRDALGYSAVGMMHEAVDRLNPKRGVKYVEAYAKTNGALLDTLVAQITRAQDSMSQREQIAFALSAASRPYAREAVDLIPRFVRKYRQVRAVSRITGGLKDVLLGKAAERLGGLLGEGGVRAAGQGPLHPQREREAERHPRRTVGVVLEPDASPEPLDGLLRDG